jgi:voltage-gated potassium channel
MDRLKRRCLFIVAAILLALAGGTAGFTLIEGYPPFDAFYMTLITITTVGYTELRVLSRTGRIFNSALIIYGVTVMFFAIGAMTQAVLEMELPELFGRRRVRRMIDKLENHYIVCGYGRVGRAAAWELRQAEVPFVMVDRSPERVEQAVRAGMLALNADSTRDQTLLEAGVTRAHGLIAALATDADNLFVILSAKNLNPRLMVAARAGEDEAEQKLRRAGADVVFAPYSNAGHQLALSLLRPHVVQFLDGATRSIGLEVGIEQVRVTASSEFVSRSLQQLQVRRELGVIVLAIRKADGRMQFNPPADAVMEADDCLIVMGERDNLRRLEQRLTETRA